MSNLPEPKQEVYVVARPIADIARCAHLELSSFSRRQMTITYFTSNTKYNFFCIQLDTLTFKGKYVPICRFVNQNNYEKIANTFVTLNYIDWKQKQTFW